MPAVLAAAPVTRLTGLEAQLRAPIHPRASLFGGESVTPQVVTKLMQVLSDEDRRLFEADRARTHPSMMGMFGSEQGLRTGLSRLFLTQLKQTKRSFFEQAEEWKGDLLLLNPGWNEDTFGAKINEAYGAFERAQRAGGPGALVGLAAVLGDKFLDPMPARKKD